MTAFALTLGVTSPARALTIDGTTEDHSGTAVSLAHGEGAVPAEYLTVINNGVGRFGELHANSGAEVFNAGTLVVTGRADARSTLGFPGTPSGYSGLVLEGTANLTNVDVYGGTYGSNLHAVEVFAGSELTATNFNFIGRASPGSDGLHSATIGSTVTGDGDIIIKLTNGNISSISSLGGRAVWLAPLIGNTSITATFDNVNILASNAAWYGLYLAPVTQGASNSNQQATLTMNGGRIEITSDVDPSRMYVAAYVGSQTFNANGVTIVANMDGARGLQAAGGAIVNVNGGSVSTAGAEAQTISMTTGARLAVTNGAQVIATGSQAAALSLYGTATDRMTPSVTGSTISSAAGAAVMVRGTNTTLTLTDSVVSGAVALFDAGTRSTGPTPAKLEVIADHSTLTGASRPNAASTLDLTLRNGTLWTITPALANTIAGASTDTLDLSRVSNLTNDGSTIAFAPQAGDVFGRLVVDGNYTAVGDAVLVLNTRLDAGGALAAQGTDRLIVNGNVTGTTLVRVNPTATSVPGLTSADGTNRASEGISLIQVGGTAAENSFSLAGGYVALNGQPYQYRLNAYGPNAANGAADAAQNLTGAADGEQWDYRLQSAYVEPPPNPPSGPPAQPPVPAIVPQGGAYLVAPNALFQAGLQDLGNLHRRLGEIRDDRTLSRDTGTGEAWLRGYGGSHDYSTNLDARQYGFDASVDYAAVQMGGNLFLHRSDTATTRVGLAASIGRLDFDPDVAGASVKGRTDTYSLSAYMTRQSDAGWYVDAIMSFGLFDGEVSTNLRGKTADVDGSSFGVSLETGYPVALGFGGLNVEPQVQLTYQRLSFDNARDVDGFDVSIGTQQQLVGRVGARLTRAFDMGEGQLVTPYAKVNVLHGFLDGGDVRLGTERFSTGDFGTAIEVGGGVTATLRGGLSVYADAAWQTELGDAGFQGWTASAGLRYAF